MTSHEAEGNEATIRQIMELISAGRADDMLDLLDDEFLFELPYGPEGMPPSFDKKMFGPMQSATFKMFGSFSLQPVEFHPLLDPAGLVVEYQSEAVVAATGEPYRNRYIGVFRFRDGKVLSWREYHNPEVATRALSG